MPAAPRQTAIRTKGKDFPRFFGRLVLKKPYTQFWLVLPHHFDIAEIRNARKAQSES